MNVLSKHNLSKWLIAGTTAALIACTGGGSGDSQVAGIEGTGVTSGFGSIFVNGVEFFTSDARIIINGEEGAESELRVGDVVTVVGVIDEDGNATARRVEFNRMLDGPVQSIDQQNGRGTLSTLEQTVQFDESTTFINTSAQTLDLNDLIAISGQRDASGVLHATSIERNNITYSFSTRIDAEGTVSNLDAAAQRFNLGALVVDYAGVNTLEESAGDFENGAFVDVFGRQNGDGEALRADTVRVLNRGIGQPGELVQIDAVIQGFDSLADFELNGQPVNAADAERLDNASLAPANGVRVEVEGRLQSGVVVVDTLSVRPPSDRRLSATVNNVTDNGFGIFGQDAQVLPVTQYLDANARRFRIDSLAAGNRVNALGYIDSEGQFIIMRLERTTSSSTSQVRGPATNIDAGNGSLDIARVTVRTDSSTDFQDAQGNSIDATAFFSAIENGQTVEASGPENAQEINVADRAQLLSE